MSSPYRSFLASLCLLLILSSFPLTAETLKVCADPNNLPFSNNKLEGFENKIANLIAAELHSKVDYTWWAQRRGFIRNTLKTGKCDLVMGMPTSMEMAATTRPYYRSTYVFVTRKDRSLSLSSLDDPALKKLRIGVQLIGDDGMNSPPVHALNRRGIVTNLIPFPVYGDYSKPNPAMEILNAVVNRKVDLAIVWGPFAGYFAKKAPVQVTPVSPQIDLPYMPFVFDISMGVRRGDDKFREQLDQLIVRKHSEIEKILDEYGVPRVL